MIKKWLLYIALLMLSYNAYATDYHVRSGGSNWPCGSIASPCGNISTVIKNTTGSANIKIVEGTYYDNIHIRGTVFENIQISGGWRADFTAQKCNPILTILRPSAEYVSLLRVQSDIFQSIDVDVLCLTFNGVGDTNRTGISLYGNHGTLKFSMSKSIIDGFAGTGLSVSSVARELEVDIYKSVIKNNYQPVGQVWSGGGISAIANNHAQLTITLENSLLYGNQAHGGAAIDLTAIKSASGNLSLINNTISDNYSADINGISSGGLVVVASDSGQAAVNIRNTILWGNSNNTGSGDISIGQRSTGVATVDAGYSVVGEVGISYGGTYNDNGNNMNIDPKLNSTYRLSSDSPAIDMAQCGTHFFTYTRIAPYDDIDGDLRPGYGALLGCDIGADEFAAHGCFPYTPNGKMLMICW